MFIRLATDVVHDAKVYTGMENTFLPIILQNELRCVTAIASTSLNQKNVFSISPFIYFYKK